MNPAHEADFLILTHRNFRAAVQPLAAARNAQGLLTEVVTLEDVYDEINDGVPSARAVSQFLRWTYEKWQRAPRYVLLVGDASYDPRNYLGYGNQNYAPTRLVATPALETASDEALVDFDGDGIGEMSVGRFPARTPEQVATLVSKTLGYTPAPDARGALLVSDNADNGLHASTINDLRSILPGAMPVTYLARGAQPDAALRTQILATLNAGPSVVAYAGHGSSEVWTGAGLLQASDAAALTNGNRLPLFVSLTCLNGYFAVPSAESLAESLVKAPNGGAVAVWASSGLTIPPGQATMGQALFQMLYGNSPAPLLGDAVRQAKRATTDSEVRQTWLLFGDPTLRIR